MAKIRNPQAFAAWLARKQMAQTQQQNVSAYDQGGVDAQTRQQLVQALAQQSVTPGKKKSLTSQEGLFQGTSIFESHESLFSGNLFD